MTDVTDASRPSYGLMTPTFFVAGETCDLARLQEAARCADEYGFDTIWVGDHLIGRRPNLEAMVTLGVLAGCVQRASIGTNVLQLPLRRAIDVSKSIETLAYLTRGRLILGIGVGGEWEAEWAAAGVERQTRGRRCDEALEALNWYRDGQNRTGRFFASPGVAVQPQGPYKIWVGGRSNAAIERACRHDGYIGTWLSPSRIQAIRAQVTSIRGNIDNFGFGLQVFVRIDEDESAARREARDAVGEVYGIDPAPLERYLVTGTPQNVAAACAELQSVGIRHLSFFLMGSDWSTQVRRLCTEVLPLLNSEKDGRS